MLDLPSLAIGLLASASVVSAQTALPIVDLGYERHQAINYNDSAKSYNFSNIPFAKPPLGDLRFRAAVPAWEGDNNSTVNDGSVGAVCPQAVPPWQAIAAAFVPKYLKGEPFNRTDYVAQLRANGTEIPLSVAAPDARQTEDCLKLDVVVPDNIFNGAGNGFGAPVLVYIYGGGYVEGEKTGTGEYNPYGFFESAQSVLGQRFIWVSINYRVGAFGFLAGPTLQTDGTSNAAFYDQKTSLEWVQKYIHLFGGDPNRVTVMGESAGAGSIMHQITAYNGAKPTLFQQAIPLSPAWQPIVSSNVQETTFNGFLAAANVTSLSALRNLSTEQLQQANIQQIGESAYGTFAYGPAVDGIFAPQLPGRAFISGPNFDPNLRLLIGHAGDEGLLFSDPNVNTSADFKTMIQRDYPTISDSVTTLITDQYYPPIYNGSYGYTTDFERSKLLVADSAFTCNTYYLGKAYPNAYSYYFTVPPALHGQDGTYEFAYNDSSQEVPIVATALKEYIVSFVITGNPNSGNRMSGVPNFPQYGSNNTLLELNKTISTVKDDLAGPRCDFWQKALFA